jgi:hypothetical protein
MPQQRVLQHLVPWTDARQGSIDRNKAPHAFRVLDGEGVADHVTDVVRDQIGTINLERVENARYVAGLRLLVKSRNGLRGKP